MARKKQEVTETKETATKETTSGESTDIRLTLNSDCDVIIKNLTSPATLVIKSRPEPNTEPVVFDSIMYLCKNNFIDIYHVNEKKGKDHLGPFVVIDNINKLLMEDQLCPSNNEYMKKLKEFVMSDKEEIQEPVNMKIE